LPTCLAIIGCTGPIGLNPPDVAGRRCSSTAAAGSVPGRSTIWSASSPKTRTWWTSAAGRPSRRTPYGTSLIRTNADIVLVAELMGHNDLETTRLYTLPTDADVEAAVARLPADR
jgi:integrase